MAVKLEQLEVGTPVRYQPKHYGHDKWENGIVKSFNEHNKESVFVVYNCGNDWGNFKNYTAASTNIRDLHLNWKNEH